MVCCNRNMNNSKEFHTLWSLVIEITQGIVHKLRLQEEVHRWVVTNIVCQSKNVDFLVPSMWFWSVSRSTNCPDYFSFFLVDQKKIVQSQGIFGQSLGIFGRPKSGVHVLLVSLFGIPIVRSISHYLKKTGQKIQES